MTRFTLAAVGVALFVLICGCGPPTAGPGSKPAGKAKPPEDSPKRKEDQNAKLRRYPNSDFPPSIVKLLAHPERYHGKKVQVEGFLRVRFEGTAIYLSRDDAEYGITRNGFWVEFDPKAIPFRGGVKPKQLDNKYVFIQGTFDKDSFGHFGLWSGTIGKIDRAFALERDR